jgi:hypothetical protein
LFLAEPNYWAFQCDLSGADGWTVAAYCAMLGDRTMLDDYLYGLKPAKIACAYLRNLSFDPGDRASIKEVCKTISSDSWDYFACKRVQHGTNLLMGDLRLSNQILTDSEGAFYYSSKQCNELQSVYHHRYPGIRKWQDLKRRGLSQSRTIVAASGQRRVFFGRNEEILPKALSFENQANTTYATNMAMWRLYSDPENRKANGDLIIQPLHQVHDAIVGQFPQDRTDWAKAKIRSWFNNPMNIANHTITIPFEGSYGPSWGVLDQGLI